MQRSKTASVIISVGIGTFMSALDSSVVNMTIPVIQNDFKISLSMVEWIVTAYLLVVSSLLLTYGRIADLYGHKKVYSTGFVGFLIGSLFCGLSRNIFMLISGRIIQAIGAGMLFSTGPAIITKTVSPEKRGKALSITAVAVALGLCTGPVLGGALTALLGWQSIFFINLPIGTIGLLLVRKNIPDDSRNASAPFDIKGSVMIFAALMLILLPLNLSGDYHIPAPLFIGLITAGILIIIFFVFFEKRCENPMLDISLFDNRVFSASNAAAFLMFMAQYIMTFLTPFYLEKLRGLSSLHSGLLYLPMPIATMCIAPFSGIVSDRFDSRYISTIGAVVMSGGLFMLSFFNAQTPYVQIILTLVTVGVGFGMFQTPNNSSVMGNVPAENRGTAAGTLATMRNIGMTVGAALSGAMFSFFQSNSAESLKAKGQSGRLLERNMFVSGLHHTIIIASIIAIVAAAASFAKGKVRNFQM